MQPCSLAVRPDRGHVLRRVQRRNQRHRLAEIRVSGSSFKAQDILTGQMDVFISVDLATLQAHPGIGRVIIGALLNAVYKAEGAVADRVLFLVDEARMLGTPS
jgi:type IV secretory pathway TraG/TraD family ATPase VirD4